MDLTLLHFVIYIVETEEDPLFKRAARCQVTEYADALRDGASREHIRRIKKDSWEV